MQLDRCTTVRRPTLRPQATRESQYNLSVESNQNVESERQSVETSTLDQF